MKISKKLPLAAVSLTVLAITVGTITSLTVSGQFLKEGAAEKLQAIADGRRNQLETYLTAIEDDMKSLATIELTIRAADKFGYYFEYAGDNPQEELRNRYVNDNPHPEGEKHLLDTAGTSGYDRQHEDVHVFFREFVEKRGYDDLFFIDMKGNVAYSVYKTREFATNLLEGEWSSSGLATAWQGVKDTEEEGKTFFADFTKYGAKDNQPAAFMSQAVFKKGRLKGYLVFQMPSGKINAIINNKTGLGESGETLLLNSEGLMISDSQMTEENEALATKLALSERLLSESDGGHPVGELYGYRNDVFEISATRVNFANTNWIIGALASRGEVLSGVTTLRNIILGVSLLLIAISMGLALWFSRSITRPIAGAIAQMSELVSGKTDLDLSGAERKDEIGEIYQAVSVFRDAAIEKDRLEEEGEENRAQSEQERTHNEKLKAEDAARVNAAVEAIAEGLHSLAEGDLTKNISEPFAPELDRLRTDFNLSVSKLSETMFEITDVADRLKRNSSEISAATNDLTKRTETQAASLEETSAALDEITATVKETSDRAGEAASRAKNAREDTEKSSGVVSNAVKAMEGIENASHDINNIINVIDEIAFQTNLLALNAGVEAARAGEAGKGFAVVAQEVRELAQRSASAAKEIKDLIERSGNEVSNGVNLVQQTGEALSQISEHVTEIDSQINTISNGANEQLTGIQEVNASVNSMDQATQQNAAMAEESNAVTQEVNAEMLRLSELISTFKLDEARNTASSTAPLATAQSDDEKPQSAQLKKAAKPSPVVSGNLALAEPESNWDEF